MLGTIPQLGRDGGISRKHTVGLTADQARPQHECLRASCCSGRPRATTQSSLRVCLIKAAIATLDGDASSPSRLNDADSCRPPNVLAHLPFVAPARD